ncbi:hypothetical protein D4R87_02705 [bacterium]|nr:MAG: hypothetical protein D4R87_02705 [bacterium]
MKDQHRGLIGRFFKFISANWVVILILAVFISQIYVMREVSKINKSVPDDGQAMSDQSVESNINQIKSMMSSMYSRVNTIQGDVTYLKSRR